MASVATGWTQTTTPPPSAIPAVEKKETTYKLEIAKQPLGQALIELGTVTGLSILYYPQSRDQEKTIVGPVNGEFTVEKALRLLLTGMPLDFDMTNETTVSVSTPQRIWAQRRARGVDAVVEDAATDSTRARSGDGPEQVAGIARGKSGSTAQSAEDEVKEEVVVTGSRLRRGERGGEGPTSLVALNRTRITQSGASTLGDLLNNISQQPYTRTEGARSTGAQYAEIRGIGADTTSILINGRRLVPSANSLTNNAFDLNTIPLSAVKRIELLPDSASAVYGADAIGGVLNIILEDDIPDPVIELNYGTTDGGADERRASLSTGYWDERFKATLILDYFDRGSLLGAERDRLRNQDFRRFGGADKRSTSCNPGNVSSRTPANLPGLPSIFAAVPEGSAGVGLAPADFLATAGGRNLCNLLQYATLVPETVRKSAVGSVETSLAQHATAFAELLYVDRSSEYQLDPPSLVNMLVPESNAFNPFGTAVNVNYLFSALGPRQTLVDSSLVRAVTGMKGERGEWKWDLSVLRTAEDSTIRITNTLDPARVNAALASSDPTQALNVFQDGPGGSAALLASLVAPSQPGRYESGSTQGSGYVNGPLFRMPTGSVNAVIGGEWRREKVLLEDFMLVSRHRLVRAGFLEADVPLIPESAMLPFIRQMSVSVAARLDHYSDFGSTFNPRYGLTWKPLDELTVNASYGSSFRPPSMIEMFTPRVAVPVRLPDPRRNNEPVIVEAVAGGNPDLDPIRANSVSAGFAYKSQTPNELEFSANYWRIQMRNRITVVPVTVLLTNEAVFPDRVVRDEPTPADIEAGLPGTLRLLDLSRVNFGRLRTSGVDFRASMVWDTPSGRYMPRVAATWVREFTAEELPFSRGVERVSRASPLGTIARWRVIATMGWERNGLGLSATARYVPPYHDATFFGASNQRVISPATIIDAQVSLDLGEAFDLSPHWSGLKLTAGVNNLLDEEPPFAEVGDSFGYDASQGDLKQRYGYILVTKKF